MHHMFLFYPIIVVLGIVTSYTDLKFRKIRNSHLLWAVVCGLMSYLYLIVTHRPLDYMNLPLNILFGFAMGMILYLTDTWAAGDAKLFAVYCLLMPTEKYSEISSFTSFIVFLNVFLVSTLVVVLLSLFKMTKKDFYKILIRAFSLTFLRELFNSFMLVFSLGWAISPVAASFMPQITPFLYAMVLFFSYLGMGYLIKKYKNHLFIVVVLAVGLGLRFLLQSTGFHVTALAGSLKTIAVYSFAFYILRSMLDLNRSDGEDEKSMRFAPMMFLGVFLVNTNFMYWVMHWMNALKR